MGLDNATYKLVYYRYNDKQRRHYETTQKTWTIGCRLLTGVNTIRISIGYRSGIIMYVLTIGSIVYLYDNEKDARKAFHQSVAKNGINNVKVTYV